MNEHQTVSTHRLFFATAPLPCPYLPGKFERRLVTDLSGRDASLYHDILSQAGFRRSHGIAYVPVCRNCSACTAVRVKALAFEFSRAMRRVLRVNQDLLIRELAPRPTEEQYKLFDLYQHNRHANGEMSRMTFTDYGSLVEDTPVETFLLEARTPRGELVGVCLTDQMSDGFSAVYSFFDPIERRRSMGTFLILMLVLRARRLGLPHVYLGFWVAACQKMNYKCRFQPLEAYTGDGWRPLRHGKLANDDRNGHGDERPH